ncbi:hypothetical protein XBJ2_1570074 [Xenorhabdus bovienii str. Jollieti]|nr:hypothetical protein XBJ2_1570074 [Xenorhabdus bovienii str. Jollieti]
MTKTPETHRIERYYHNHSQQLSWKKAYNYPPYPVIRDY